MSHRPSTPEAPVDFSSFDVKNRAFEHVDPFSVVHLGQRRILSHSAGMEQVSSSSSSLRVEQISEGRRCDEHMPAQGEDIEAKRKNIRNCCDGFGAAQTILDVRRQHGL